MYIKVYGVVLAPKIYICIPLHIPIRLGCLRAVLVPPLEYGFSLG